jgi:hypothetical protein
MNYLVTLDARAGELEKILSGVKTMLVKEFDPAQTSALSVNPDDSLYFLRDQDDSAVRVKATVVRVLNIHKAFEEDTLHALKEMQPRLQLTEEQFNFWAGKDDMQLVEFESAHKISVIQVASRKTTDAVNWIAFETISQDRPGPVV